ncbi:PP2C family protein-serine/threonine phosphatase [Cerasicoccus maritimus]|uniref:PP2C family protein-serine/threonine phosphatase n=1 Tax=Cerasicoccus maritimus TaxID=490089 RepID=UPI002852A1AD|nr:protein phosphatase 2C domain-containing protein [Cerasicoccus maritimus]
METVISYNEPTGLRWWGMTDKGRFRKNNEDAFLGLKLDGREVFRLGKIGEARFEAGDFIFAVSDGMGGANAGEFASRIAVDKITQLLPSAFRLKATGFRRGGTDFLAEVIEQIHAEMRWQGRAYEETSGMGATLSMCWFTPEKAYFGHVGDSRIYHLPKVGGYQQITYDHTPVGALVRAGKLTELEARMHPQKSLLHMALGGRVDKVDPHLGQVLYEPGDCFVFCSDGISDGISSRKIEDLVRTPSIVAQKFLPAERLIKEAWDISRDNMTAIVVEVF